MIVWGSANLIQTLLPEESTACTSGPIPSPSAAASGCSPTALVQSRVGDAGVIPAAYDPAGELSTDTMGA